MFETVLISLGTSLIVSLITFILGLKAGKSQVDCSKLQDLHKQLSSHFKEISEKMDREIPKEWSDYKQIKTGYNTFQSYPLVKDFERTGDILCIENKIAKEAIELEKECLSYSYNLKEAIFALHECIFKNSQFFEGEFEFENNEGHSCIKTINKNECNAYRTESYFIFLNRDKLESILNEWEKSNSYAIRFSIKGNPPERSFTIYPNSLKENVSVYIEKLYVLINEANLNYKKVCNSKRDLKDRLNKINKKIARRIKEPTSFWETFIGAFIDIFH